MVASFQRLERTIVLIGCVLVLLAGRARSDDGINSLQPSEPLPEIEVEQVGVELTLVAEHPDVVTPTGIDVDENGGIWVVASHTHFRPDDYGGPQHDQVLVFQPDGQRRVFYDKTDASMDLELGPDNWVYLAQRDRILRIRDADGDGRGDTEETIASLETEADYPHNGLSGLAWANNGDLIFALGENYAKPWRLTGTDGASVQGSGEGGIFRCRPDGESLRRIAKGFWNPFGVCVRRDGTMFAAENDPGSRPPCRLLHLVEGGDYGYQRRYGNASYHPFVCWNGELPGTLPMLHAVGEAPCGIVPLGDGLIVPSWTEHRIDFYPLKGRGASFETERITLVRGGDFFRPTCIAAESDTTFYLTDWVVGSYEIHGRGRVWRLTIDPQKADWLEKTSIEPATDEARLARELRTGERTLDVRELLELCRSPDAFLRSAAIASLSKQVDQMDWRGEQELAATDLISLLLAIKKNKPLDEDAAEFFLNHPDPGVQFEAMRWIAESDLVAFREDVRKRLSDPNVPYRLFEAALATSNTLEGKPELGVADPNMLVALLESPETSPTIRAYSLRLLDPGHRSFAPKLWRELYGSGNLDVITELVRSVATVGTGEANDFLSEIARDETLPASVRADAVAGLSNASPDAMQLLVTLAESSDKSLREESLRSLRFAQLDERDQQRLKRIGHQHPTSSDLIAAAIDPKSLTRSRPEAEDLTAWKQRLSDVSPGVDLDAGRRVFHHAVVGTCVKCHRHSGRGRDVGPDLSAVSNMGDADRLLLALLQPSRDVDPQYHPRMLVTDDGQVFTGILLRDGGGGREFYRDASGREQMFKTDQIVERKELKTSMMPDGLLEVMTDREIRDLLAFIEQGRGTLLTKTDANPWVGSWWFDFEDGYGGWLEVNKQGDEYQASLLWRVGAPRPVEIASMNEREITLKRRRQNQTSVFVASLQGESLAIKLEDSSERASGGRCPPMPPRPDLDSVQFGEPITLFNGRDLTGWKLQPRDAENGWRVADGELINETPKTDFSAYGDFGNLRTEAVFGDCRLHIEFNVDEKCNSGVYVGGLYEAQVVDRDSPMQGISGPGAIFGRIKPTTNAGLPGGQWQSYDITLVDRHLTVKLNGQTVIDNEPVSGCTGGALFGDVTRKGPLYLQGDHTSVRYRNIWIRPRL